MKNIKSICLLALIFFISCSNDDKYTRIEITSPVNNQTFNGNTKQYTFAINNELIKNINTDTIATITKT